MEILRGDSSSPELLAFLRGELLDLPEEVPARLEGRVRDVLGTTIAFSLPHAKPWLSSRASLEKNGIWLCGGDARARGGVEPRVFGIPLSRRLLAALGKLPCEWRVLYHGTGAEAHASISMLGLLASAGQLGHGVYLGSFWKACRFAGRDQDYCLREQPIVYRVLARRVAQLFYPRDGWKCECPRCEKLEVSRAAACDHGRTWSSGECGRLLCTQYADGGWTTRNEEWCYARNDVIRLCEAMPLDKTSINGPHYDPLQRDIRIL